MCLLPTSVFLPDPTFSTCFALGMAVSLPHRQALNGSGPAIHNTLSGTTNTDQELVAQVVVEKLGMQSNLLHASTRWSGPAQPFSVRCSPIPPTLGNLDLQPPAMVRPTTLAACLLLLAAAGFSHAASHCNGYVKSKCLALVIGDVPSYWTYPVIANSKKPTWASACCVFRDNSCQYNGCFGARRSSLSSPPALVIALPTSWCAGRPRDERASAAASTGAKGLHRRPVHLRHQVVLAKARPWGLQRLQPLLRLGWRRCHLRSYGPTSTLWFHRPDHHHHSPHHQHHHIQYHHAGRRPPV